MEPFGPQRVLLTGRDTRDPVLEEHQVECVPLALWTEAGRLAEQPAIETTLLVATHGLDPAAKRITVPFPR